MISSNAEFKRIVAAAASIANGAAGADVALSILAPVMAIVGEVLKEAKDKVLDTIDGGIHLDPQDKKRDEISDKVRSAIAEAELDFHLFDADIDTDSAAHINGSLESLKQSGLLIGS